jgi:hypothetical protein
MERLCPGSADWGDGTIDAIAGPERLALRTPAALYGEDLKTVGEFTVDAGEAVPFVLSYGSSSQSPPPAVDPTEALARTQRRLGGSGAIVVQKSGPGHERSNARS